MKRSSHLSLREIVIGIGTMFVISFIAHGIIFLGTHLFERYSSTRAFFEYESVVPTYTGFYEGELLQFTSKVDRKMPIEVVREDTPYCIEHNRQIKYPTQYRPEFGTEYKAPRKTEGDRNILQKISPDATECLICGTVIGYTSLGYKKTRSYCTDKFNVNLKGKRE